MPDDLHILMTFALALPILFSLSPGFETGARAGVGMGRGWAMCLDLRLWSGHLLIGSAVIEDEDAGSGRQQGL